LAGGVEAPSVLTGMRRQSEIDARIAALQADAAEGPISGAEMEGFDALLAVRETLPFAVQQLRHLSVDLPAIGTAVARVEARASALVARGIDVEALEFEAGYGRTSMEYYDGFVFGFSVPGRADLPPVASGGRYDALTQRLGGAQACPAVGAVIRPGLVAELEGAL